MKNVNTWTATYEDFLACSERLTEELDRFHDEIRDSKAVLVQARQFTAQVDAASKKIGEQVVTAERAWANADKVALVAAKHAHEAAFRGVQASLTGATEALAQSAQANQLAANRVDQSFTQSRKFIFRLGIGFLVVSGLAIFGAVYFASLRESPLERETRQNAAHFELIWSKATPKEKAELQKIWSRLPAAPVAPPASR
ncbi:hypothetical protein ACSFE6_01630 [Pseudomonas baetica]|uniref:hypothetical protein n=1 Tax=Pseudomonas baetica TaxID=674054 RepID=UPI003EEE6890